MRIAPNAEQFMLRYDSEIDDADAGGFMGTCTWH
jgi:hypothetical protein